MYHIKADKRSLQSSEMIFEALVQLVKEKSYQELTVTEIVQRAKLGRATFYRNFDVIDDILQWKCDKAYHGLYQYIVESYQTPGFLSSNDQFMLLKPSLRYWYVKSFIIELLIHVDRIEIIDRSYARLLDQLTPHFHKSHETILKHLDYFVAIRRGVTVSLLVQWIKNDKNIPPDELADLIIAQFNESLHLKLRF